MTEEAPSWLTPSERLQYGLPIAADDVLTESFQREIEAEMREDFSKQCGGYDMEDIMAACYLDGKDQAVDNMVSGYLAAMGLTELN